MFLKQPMATKLEGQPYLCRYDHAGNIQCLQAHCVQNLKAVVRIPAIVVSHSGCELDARDGIELAVARNALHSFT